MSRSRTTSQTSPTSHLGIAVDDMASRVAAVLACRRFVPSRHHEACETEAMPLSRGVASFNKRVTNHLTRHIAGWAPGFAIVHHVGRRSGRAYETPVNVFHRDGTYLFALTYGEGEWVRNVLAADGCEIVTRRRRIALGAPRLF